MTLRRDSPDVDEFIQGFESSLAPSHLSVYDFVNQSRIEDELSTQDSFISYLSGVEYGSKVEFTDAVTKKLLDTHWNQLRPAIDTLFEVISVSKSSTTLTVAEGEYKKYTYQKAINKGNESAADEMLEILNDAGLYSTLSEVPDIRTYLKGVKTGFESDKRKNRHGNSFEDIVELYLEQTLEVLEYVGHEFTLAKDESLLIGKREEIANEFDFVILEESNAPVVAFELNTYSGTGSKPSEIRESYISAAEATRATGIEYVWVTDGAGWKKMTTSLKLAYREVEDIYNLRQLRKQFGSDFAAYLGVEDRFNKEDNQ